MEILKVEKLNKRYPKFHLKDVSFIMEKGYIMGFIGVNGAGKTTTLKSMLNMVHSDSGKVTIMGKDYSENEIDLKKEIGYMFGGVDFYPKKKVHMVTKVLKRFYPEWDDEIYKRYCRKFRLDQDKKIDELSEGMKVKYSLALALSHNAKLFLLDEPTSGLDPAARDNLLELFQELVEDGEKSILFSTHITSDLEKCADFITYIDEGEIINSCTKDEFIGSYKIVKGKQGQLTGLVENAMISVKKGSFGFSGLMKNENLPSLEGLTVEAPNLEDIMIYHARRNNNEEFIV
jgi:ABC-2 type transport system ATP-binding protein